MFPIPSLGPRGEGWVALQVACFGLVAAAWLSASSTPSAPGTPLDTGLRLVGYGAMLGGAVLAVTGVVELRRGRALTAVPHPRSESELVESGPYRFVRHPIYGGLVLVATGLALDHLWVGSVLAVALLAVVLDLKRRREEAWLRDRFPSYPSYERRTKALIPLLY